MTERLAVDVSLTYEAEAIGKRGDDLHPCNGTKIARVQFDKQVSSRPAGRIPTPFGSIDIPGLRRGDAHTTDTDLPDIGVHYWLDAGTKLSYQLKVWVED